MFAAKFGRSQVLKRLVFMHARHSQNADKLSAYVLAEGNHGKSKREKHGKWGKQEPNGLSNVDDPRVSKVNLLGWPSKPAFRAVCQTSRTAKSNKSTI